MPGGMGSPLCQTASSSARIRQGPWQRLHTRQYARGQKQQARGSLISRLHLLCMAFLALGATSSHLFFQEWKNSLSSNLSAFALNIREHK